MKTLEIVSAEDKRIVSVPANPKRDDNELCWISESLYDKIINELHVIDYVFLDKEPVELTYSIDNCGGVSYSVTNRETMCRFLSSFN